LLALPVRPSITINGTTGNDVIDVSSSSEAHLIFAKSGDRHRVRKLCGRSSSTAAAATIAFSATPATTC
jgi:hypothetical protein